MLWQQNPNHPSLDFKKLKGFKNLYQVRVGVSYRAIAMCEGDEYTWIVIRTKAEIVKWILSA